MEKNSDKDSGIFDEIESLRTDYLRELTSLSKMLIALSTAALGLLLSPSGIELGTRAGIRSMVSAWILLSAAAVLGFVQVFTFSSRFKSRADYLWSCHIVDTLVALRAPDEKLNEFLARSDKHKNWHGRKYILCVSLVLTQGVCLAVAFGLLAFPTYRIVTTTHQIRATQQGVEAGAHKAADR
jgi:hypothetical protein